MNERCQHVLVAGNCKEKKPRHERTLPTCPCRGALQGTCKSKWITIAGNMTRRGTGLGKTWHGTTCACHRAIAGNMKRHGTPRACHRARQDMARLVLATGQSLET